MQLCVDQFNVLVMLIRMKNAHGIMNTYGTNMTPGVFVTSWSYEFGFRIEVGIEERVDVDMFYIVSGSFEAVVAELTENAGVEPKTPIFPVVFLLNFVGLMKSVIG